MNSTRNFILAILVIVAAVAVWVGTTPLPKRGYKVALLNEVVVVEYEASSISADGMCTTFRLGDSLLLEGRVIATVCASHMVAEK